MKRGEHYEIDEPTRTASLTETGARLAEDLTGTDNLYDEDNLPLAAAITAALAARDCYQKGRDYVVVDGDIRTVDPLTGRPQRGWLPAGVHGPVQAREGLAITPPRQVLAVITTWDYLRQSSAWPG